MNASSVLELAVNESENSKLLEAYLGTRHKPLAQTLVLTAIYLLVFITGVIGNVCTCIVIIRNNYMQTTTNYYLFSLAISDVLTLLLALPPETYAIWEAYPWAFGTGFCIFKVFLSEMTASASILTITAFTVERYVAICHPIRAQTMSSLSRAIKTILCLWLAACLSAVPYAVFTTTFYYVKDSAGRNIPESFVCNIPKEYHAIMKYVFQSSTFVLFVTPMTIIIVLYLRIGVTLRRSQMARNSTSVNSTGGQQKRKPMLKMLVAVVVAFFICWAPFHAQRLMTLYVEKWTTTLLYIQEFLFYISGVLYFISSTVNPILYNLMSKKYRQAFKETLCRCLLSASERSGRRDPQGRLYDMSATHVSMATTQQHTKGADYHNNGGGDEKLRSEESVLDDQDQTRWPLLSTQKPNGTAFHNRVNGKHRDLSATGEVIE